APRPHQLPRDHPRPDQARHAVQQPRVPALPRGHAQLRGRLGAQGQAVRDRQQQALLPVAGVSPPDPRRQGPREAQALVPTAGGLAMNPSRATLLIRLACALILFALVVELGSLFWSHPTSFVVFATVGGGALVLGMLLYLYWLLFA